MDRTRLSVVGLALVVLGLSVGCSSGGGGTKDDVDAGTDADPSTGDGAAGDGKDGNDGSDGTDKPDGGDNDKPDSGGGNDKPDSGMMTCITSCEEVGAECGLLDTGCGQTIDCDPEGDACEYPEQCGKGPDGDPNKCGCTPMTCEDVVQGGAECGQNIPDGCGGSIADCGDCGDKAGDNWACGDTSRVCECTATTQTEACGARECGQVDDGCGGDGYSCGACADAQTCDPSGACACKSNAEYAATACGNKTCGTVTVDGCTFTCGGACNTTCGASDDCTSGCQCANPSVCNTTTERCCTASTQNALCTGKACGTEVTDPCTGTKYTCGCGSGQSCVDKSYIEGASANQCLNNAEANLLGGYVGRVHAFLTLSTGGLQRAESVSLVKIAKKQNGTYEMTDTGCVATTVSNDGATTSVAESYFKIPPVVRPIQVSGNDFTRAFAQPGVGLGFIPNLPPYCDGVNATPTAANRGDFDAMSGDASTAPTPGSGAVKPWLTSNGGLCTCPTAQATSANNGYGYCDPTALAQLDPSDPNYTTKFNLAKNCLPRVYDANNNPVPSDCRINDADGDSKAGVTARANRYINWTGAITFANIEWDMTLDANGNHTGTAADPSPLYRQVIACSGLLCGALALVTNESCGQEQNLVQFRKLAPTDFASLTCGAFYNVDITVPNPVDNINDVKQSAIDAYFQGIKSCSGGCPAGTICQQNQCWPRTTNGACAGGVACGDGLECVDDVGNSCWPTTETCN